jgi:glycosyltransferase involved in cell wall biosynthesis
MTEGNEKKIRVLFITKWYPNQEDPQLAIFVKKHALAVARFADVSLLYISPFNPALQVTDFYISEEKNVRQYFLYYRKSSVRLLNLLRYFMALRKGWKAIVKNSGKPDLVHAHTLTRPGVIAWLLSAEHRIPYLITEHWTGFVNNKFNSKPGWYRLITRFAVNHAARLTVVSGKLKEAMERSGFNKSMDVVPNVVDLPLQPVANTAVQGKKIFLTVADLLDVQKNISATIKAVSRISKQRSDFEFHIIGGGPDEAMLHRLATDLGIKDIFVFFHGRKPNEAVYDFLNGVNFVVVNSMTETFSVVTGEALACGKPVIATISGGPEEIITARTGLLIEKGNDSALESSIIHMLDNYYKYDPQALQDEVAVRFSSDTIGRIFNGIYIDMLKKWSPGK